MDSLSLIGARKDAIRQCADGTLVIRQLLDINIVALTGVVCLAVQIWPLDA